MRKIKYPLIVSDFDGTLARQDGTVGEKTKEAIRRYIQNGGCFVVNTGRMPAAVLPKVREMGLKGILCCGQGSVILDIESGNPIMQLRLPNDVSVQICKKMEALGLHTHAYDLSHFYANMDDEPLKLYEAAVGVKAKLVVDKPLWQYIAETGMCSFKFLAMVEPQNAAFVIESLTAANFPNCIVTQSASFLVEVCNEKCSKGTALDYLAEWKGVSLENIIAIGDEWNDLPMIQKAGLGLAVANASERLKEGATVLPCTNDEDAVAYVIENYAYTEE